MYMTESERLKEKGYELNTRSFVLPMIFLGTLRFVEKELFISNYERRLKHVTKEGNQKNAGNDSAIMLGFDHHKDLYDLLVNMEKRKSKGRTREARYEEGKLFFVPKTGQYLVLPIWIFPEPMVTMEARRLVKLEEIPFFSANSMTENIPFFPANTIRSKAVVSDIIPGFEEYSDTDLWFREVYPESCPVADCYKLEIETAVKEEKRLYLINETVISASLGRILEELCNLFEAENTIAEKERLSKLYEAKNNDSAELDDSYKRIYLDLKKKYTEVRDHKGDCLVDTAQQKFLFHYALQHAKKQLFISSPWIKFRKMNSDRTFLDLKMGSDDCPDCYGLPYEKGDVKKEVSFFSDIIGLINKEEFERLVLFFGYEPTAEEDASRNALNELYNRLLPYPEVRNKIHVYHRYGNHQKIVIMDQSFLVVGSYNFLSFEGVPYEKGEEVIIRQERGYFTQSKELIRDMWGEVNRQVNKGEVSPV